MTYKGVFHKFIKEQIQIEFVIIKEYVTQNQKYYLLKIGENCVITRKLIDEYIHDFKYSDLIDVKGFGFLVVLKEFDCFDTAEKWVKRLKSNELRSV